MTTPLLPQAFWFRLSIPCSRIEALPKAGAKGRLLDLPGSSELPDLAPLEGKLSWANVRVAWNPRGLAFAVEATSPSVSSLPGDQSEASWGAQVWVDTRDNREVHRANRFCHKFSVRLLAAGPKGALGVEVEQRPIARALADAPACRPEMLTARAERLRAGWRLELFLHAEALHGFDPETNRRLGLAFQITDPNRDDQFLGVGREFPIGEDPSLWSTLELRDES